MQMQLAAITDEQLLKIRALEEELDTVLVAVDGTPETTTYASLDQSQLSRLRETENDLDCVVVAYAI